MFTKLSTLLVQEHPQSSQAMVNDLRVSAVHSFVPDLRTRSNVVCKSWFLAKSYKLNLCLLRPGFSL